MIWIILSNFSRAGCVSDSVRTPATLRSCNLVFFYIFFVKAFYMAICLVSRDQNPGNFSIASASLSVQKARSFSVALENLAVMKLYIFLAEALLLCLLTETKYESFVGLVRIRLCLV